MLDITTDGDDPNFVWRRDFDMGKWENMHPGSS